MSITEELLKILACPKCKKDIIYDSSRNILICKNCNVYYEIREGIPVMLIEEAKPLKEADS